MRNTEKFKPLSPDKEKKLAELALKYAPFTARRGREGEAESGELFLRMRRWCHNRPNDEIGELDIKKLALNIRTENFRKEHGRGKSGQAIRHFESIEDVTTNRDGDERLVGYPTQLIEDNTAADRDHADFVRLLKKLPARLRKVIELRQEGYSLEEIGSHLSVTVERARQLANEAITKMRLLAQK